jgi:hypothetical protein
MLPILLLGVPIWQHFHPTHEWLEGKVRDSVNKEIAPATVSSVHCNVTGDTATCNLSTSDRHAYAIHVTKNGDTWTVDRVTQVS